MTYEHYPNTGRRGKKMFFEDQQGNTAKVVRGFSWTTFFFGFFPALFRGDLKWAGIIFISTVPLNVIAQFSPVGLALLLMLITIAIQLFFSFKYNELHEKDLVAKGFQPVTYNQAPPPDTMSPPPENNPAPQNPA